MALMLALFKSAGCFLVGTSKRSVVYAAAVGDMGDVQRLFADGCQVTQDILWISEKEQHSLLLCAEHCGSEWSTF
jgi:hypothetical protein